MDFTVPARVYKLENYTFSPELIQQIAAQKGLVGLSCRHCNITDGTIAQFRGLTKLQNVMLENCCITDKSFEYFAQLPSLKYLFITGAKINGEGLRHFSGNKKLEALWLQDTQFCDAQVHHLLGFARLGTVRIHNTLVTPEGLMSVAASPCLGFVPNEVLTLEVVQQFEAEQRRLQKRKEEVNGADVDAASDRLRGFFQAMNRWEASAEEVGFTSAVEAECRAIFQVYCVDKDRKNYRPNAMHHCYAPHYTYAHQVIVDCEQRSKDRLFLFARDTHLNKQYKYVMLRRDGEWRIDEVYAYCGGWGRSSL